MNAPSEIVLLRELLWDRAQDVVQHDQAVAAIKAQISGLLMGWGVPFFSASLLLLIAVLFFYQPRIPRYALWMPAFGLFGGTPKLYMHSRPPSLFGVLLKSRHRLFVFRRHHKSSVK